MHTKVEVLFSDSLFSYLGSGTITNKKTGSIHTAPDCIIIWSASDHQNMLQGSQTCYKVIPQCMTDICYNVVPLCVTVR